MKLFTLFVLFGVITLTDAFAQQEHTNTIREEIIEEEIVYEGPIPATYPGGFQKLAHYLKKKLKYPRDAKKARAEGKIFVEFVVARDGSIDKQSIKVTKREGVQTGLATDVNSYASCRREAMRLIMESDKWSPATQNGKPVLQRLIVMVAFEL